MTKRLKLLFDEILPCRVFADVGCDHGHIAKAVLESGKGEFVIVSDISEKSLQKAKDALCNRYGDRIKAVVADGFDGLGNNIDEALIAGMGGEEIAGILYRADTLPKRLILSPQHNSDKVRIALIDLGYTLEKDTSFSDGKLYYLIVAVQESGKKEEYSDDEIQFGRDNINCKNDDFRAYVCSEIDKLRTKISDIGGNPPLSLKEKIDRLRRIYEHISSL